MVQIGSNSPNNVSTLRGSYGKSKRPGVRSGVAGEAVSGRRWQAWVKMRGAFGGHFVWQAQYLVNLDGVSHFVKLSSDLLLDMVMIPCGRCNTSDASGSFFVAGAVLRRPRHKVAENRF